MELCQKLITGQEARETITLVALLVHDDRGRCPQRLEAMEPGGIFLDVNFDRQEILINEVENSGIGIDLGIQPGASASRGHGAEIQQNGFVRLLRLRKSSINIFRPLNRHIHLTVWFGCVRGEWDGRILIEEQQAASDK